MGSVGKLAERLRAVSEGLCTKRKKKKKNCTARQFPWAPGAGISAFVLYSVVQPKYEVLPAILGSSGAGCHFQIN